MTAEQVSIHTRPEGRVTPAHAESVLFPSDGFNPHPARRPGDTRCWLTGLYPPWWFQSTPGPKAG